MQNFINTFKSSEQTMKKIERVLSGVQPTGSLHIGNYLGSIKNFIPLQEKYPALYCVVDQHAVTTPQNPQDLKQSVRSVAAAFLAAGVNPKKSIIFNQSAVPAHAQMAWVLNCVARMGWLNRMTQFKEKAGKNKENASVGLFTYPVLMAADILCYHATHVPVGADQKQHIELARDIAVKFNLDHAKTDFFPLPEPVFMHQATRIMSLRDGTQKMSKSDPSDYARINLTDSDDVISSKFRKAKTDAQDMPQNAEDLENRPEIRNLYTIYSALTNKALSDVIVHFADKNFSSLKTELADVAICVIRPFRLEIEKTLADTDYIDTILKQGSQQAQTIAAPIVRQTYDIIGFL